MRNDPTYGGEGRRPFRVSAHLPLPRKLPLVVIFLRPPLSRGLRRVRRGREARRRVGRSGGGGDDGPSRPRTRPPLRGLGEGSRGPPAGPTRWRGGRPEKGTTADGDPRRQGRATRCRVALQQSTSKNPEWGPKDLVFERSTQNRQLRLVLGAH